MGANSAQYLHHVIEAIKLGFVDTTWYCADSNKVEVPIDWLLSKDYATKRRSLINSKKYERLYDYGICYYYQYTKQSCHLKLSGDMYRAFGFVLLE